jgi:hypothetical protein
MHRTKSGILELGRFVEHGRLYCRPAGGHVTYVASAKNESDLRTVSRGVYPYHCTEHADDLL